MAKLIKILSIFFIASLVVPALGETKMLKAERTAAELDRVEAELARMAEMLKGKTPDEAIGILNKAKEGEAVNLVWVKNIVNKRVIKTITNYDSKLGQLVEYPKYNNVALGKGSGGALEQFGKEVGANVWTTKTDNIFTSMYDLPNSWTFERSISSVLDETVGANQGKILFDINGVDIQKAVTGGLVHTPKLVLEDRLVTELELQMILRNESWFNNTIFHEGGKVLTKEELLSKGIKLIK